MFSEALKIFHEEILHTFYGDVESVDQKVTASVNGIQELSGEMQQLDVLLQSKRDGFVRDTGLILNSGF